ncbi:26252_t:CDS:2, partial [Gigaspora rosea]
NDLAGVKQHGANKGCRTCQVSKKDLTNNNLDFKNLARYQHITNSQIYEIVSAITMQEPSTNTSRHHHATAGKIARILKLTVNLFLPE